MKQADLRKKLSERFPVAREAVKPVNLYDLPVMTIEEPEGTPAHSRTNALTHSKGALRVNRGYKLREDLIKELKSFALNSDRKLYEVMEEAMVEYLQKNKKKA